MSTNHKGRPITYPLVILICMVGAFGLAWVGVRFGILDTVNPPERLPGAPEQMMRITGIDVQGFHNAAPVFQGESGTLYRFDRFGDPSNWEAVDGIEASYDADCSTDAVQIIEGAAGVLVACRTVETLGELCPGPILAYAIDSDGGVWEFERHPACFVENWILYGLSCIAGLLMGLFIVLGIWLVRRRVEGGGDV